MSSGTQNTYADRLRDALDRDGWSQARLVRALSERTGNAVESERSAVRGYLTGAQPRPERAVLIAEITGVSELAMVEHRSAAARLEALLAELAANDAAMLENQEEAMGVLREIRDELALLREGGRTAAKPSRRGKAAE